MIAKQMSNGEYYVVRKSKSSGNRNWFFVKHRPDCNTGTVLIRNINFPKEFLGKKIRLKIEIVDEGEIK